MPIGELQSERQPQSGATLTPQEKQSLRKTKKASLKGPGHNSVLEQTVLDFVGSFPNFPRGWVLRSHTTLLLTMVRVFLSPNEKIGLHAVCLFVCLLLKTKC